MVTMMGNASNGGHLHGPIEWLEWGDEAFTRAADEGRLVLLDIFGTWCHWCHVMDETTYEDPEVIDLVRTLYVPVRVDTDRYPDVNDRYNQGGWPTTAILDPTGHVLAGATYVPPEQMARLLKEVPAAYRAQSESIARRLALHEAEAKREPVVASRLPPGAVEATLDAMLRGLDARHGGFGTAPKFPQPAALGFALEQYVLTGREDLGEMVRRSLEGMLPLSDITAGGFYRYSTTADWRVPHFEKMLEGNAGLLAVYADGYRVLGDAEFARIAGQTAAYMAGPLYDRRLRAFHSSQDADIFSDDPSRPTIHGEDYFVLDARERAEIGEPAVDRTIVTPYNALAITGLVKAHLALEPLLGRNAGSPLADHRVGASAPEGVDYLDLAFGAADFLLDTMQGDDGAFYHYHDGERPQRPGLLCSQVSAANALLDLHELTGAPQYLDAATRAMDWAIDNLRSEGGGLYDVPGSPGAVGLLRHRDKPVLENARAARAAVRLGHHTGRDAYLSLARDALRCGAATYGRYGFMGAEYAQSAWLLESPARVVKIVASAPRAAEFAGAALRTLSPGLVVVHLHPDRDTARLQAESLATDVEAAYFCVGKACRRARTPEELAAMIGR